MYFGISFIIFSSFFFSNGTSQNINQSNLSNHNSREEEKQVSQGGIERLKNANSGSPKRGKTGATNSRLVSVLFLIDEAGGASFLDQSPSVER